jgi:hypothetical protein
MKNFYNQNVRASQYGASLIKGEGFIWFIKVAVMAILMLLSVTVLHAQSGGWDSWGTDGTAGNNDYGLGVTRLLSDVNTGCASAAVHETSAKYDPTVGNFSQCYQVFFGCPGADNIGSDVNGDGMAFSFSKCAYNINNGLSCGGGLGYMGACAQMITIEFDTWSSQGNTNFDNIYGGGTSGDHDEIALHRDGDASFNGRITSTDAGNLEDGLEHTVCITYNRTTHILAVTIDGAPKFSYDLTGSPYELAAYFGAGGLNQTWSSGKYGATNPSTVTHTSAQSIVAVTGPLCPAGVDITSPSDGSVFSGCPVGPITINVTANPPASNTVTFVEFFVDGVSIGTDNTANYSMVWNSPTTGNHALTAVAHWSGGGSTTSPANNISVGGVLKTSTAPVVGGGIDAIWATYPSTPITNLSGTLNSGVNDLAASYKITYDNTYLYVLVDVTDDISNTTGAADWEKDGIEIFIDRGNEKIGCCSYDANDYQFTFVRNGVINGNGKPITGITSGVTAKAGPTGYIMEVRIPWTSIVGGYPAAGTYMGFDVGINDDDDGGTRDNQMTWNNGGFEQWHDPSRFGTIQFSDCDPMPVSIKSFTGNKVNTTVVLNWTTVLELNNHHFVIERSSDLFTWESIGEVAAMGNSNSYQQYTFTDYAPLPGIAYYRLRQVDFNGASSNSNVVKIEEDGLQSSISIFPNPFDDVITIHNISQGKLAVSIYDVLGRLMFEVLEEAASGSLTIHPVLPSGTYVITVKSESAIEQQKLIKK